MFEAGLEKGCSRLIPVQPDRALSSFAEEWAKIAASRCARLIETFQQRLSVVIEAKGASTLYCCGGGEYFSNPFFTLALLSINLFSLRL